MPKHIQRQKKSITMHTQLLRSLANTGLEGSYSFIQVVGDCLMICPLALTGYIQTKYLVLAMYNFFVICLRQWYRHHIYSCGIWHVYTWPQIRCHCMSRHDLPSGRRIHCDNPWWADTNSILWGTPRFTQGSIRLVTTGWKSTYKRRLWCCCTSVSSDTGLMKTDCTCPLAPVNYA